jgi:hypothetical protein
MENFGYVPQALNAVQKAANKVSDFLEKTYEKDASHNPWVERAVNATKMGYPLEAVVT